MGSQSSKLGLVDMSGTWGPHGNNERGDLAARCTVYRWTGRIWELTGWTSRLQENIPTVRKVTNRRSASISGFHLPQIHVRLDLSRLLQGPTVLMISRSRFRWLGESLHDFTSCFECWILSSRVLLCWWYLDLDSGDLERACVISHLALNVGFWVPGSYCVDDISI